MMDYQYQIEKITNALRDQSDEKAKAEAELRKMLLLPKEAEIDLQLIAKLPEVYRKKAINIFNRFSSFQVFYVSNNSRICNFYPESEGHLVTHLQGESDSEAYLDLFDNRVYSIPFNRSER